MRGHFKNIQHSLTRAIRALTRGHAIQNSCRGIKSIFRNDKGAKAGIDIRIEFDKTKRSACNLKL